MSLVLTRGRYVFALLLLPLATSPTHAAAVTLPDGSKIEQVDFERHVQGLLGRLGCNAGACHGSFQGKGGLYLSLFGYSPEKDFLSFTRDHMGRRVSVGNPDESLILAKASGQTPHGGGKRIEKGSWQYNVIREWIAQGTPWKAGAGEVRGMSVTPTEHLLAKPGDSGRFKLLVEFADGSKEDMTFFSEFRVNDDYVAELSGGVGEVRSLRPGDTAVVISYRGNVLSARALVKVPAPAGFQYPQLAEVNYIDREVFAKLNKLNVVPSAVADDGEFLRRITIDTIGCLPTPDEVRAFLSDKAPDKRTKKIDELLQHPMHAALWATKFSDITGNNVDVMEQPQQLRPKRSKMWHDWFRVRIAANVPYNEIAKGVLTATSRDGLSVEDWVKQTLLLEGQAAAGWDSDYAKRPSLDLFWRRNQFPVEQMGEHTAAAFLGIRLECAQCHKHPFDRWTQDDYRAYSNIFASVRFAPSTDGQKIVGQQAAEIKKLATDALAQVERDFVDKKRPIEEAIDRENAEKRAAAIEKLDQDAAARRKATEEKFANESADALKAALEKLDKDNEAASKKSLSALDRDLAAAKKAALAPIEKDIAAKKAEVQAKYKTPAVQQLREVVLSDKPAPRPANGPPAYANRPKALGGPEFEVQGDPRVALFNWLRQPDNPFFARSFVNRVWAHYFGIGLVDPVDNFSVANPPSNEKLLDALAKDFVESKYDIRKLERTILLSRTYQLSAIPNESNKHDRNSNARAYPRRMMAEVVVDVLNSALGATENFGPEVQPGARAIEVAVNRLQQNPNLTNVFRLFGRPPRASTCDCERPAEPALPQTLYLMTDPQIQTKITGGRVKDLLASKKTDEEAIDELFLATLCRLPSDKERASMTAHVKAKTSRQAGLVDVVWALINTREFILNH